MLSTNCFTNPARGSLHINSETNLAPGKHQQLLQALHSSAGHWDTQIPSKHQALLGIINSKQKGGVAQCKAQGQVLALGQLLFVGTGCGVERPLGFV